MSEQHKVTKFMPLEEQIGCVIFVIMTCPTHSYTRVAWLEVNGTKYSPNNAVVLEVTELPILGPSKI